MAETINRAIEQVRSNDAELTVFAPNSSQYRLRAAEYTASLCEALSAGNSSLKELRLVDCGLTDVDVKAVATALARNTGLILVDLSKNKITNEGASALAEGLRTNSSLKELVLLEISRVGDPTIQAFTAMLEQSNTTLTKITWRLETRSSTRLNSLTTRNKEIERRLKQGKPVDDLMPKPSEEAQ